MKTGRRGFFGMLAGLAGTAAAATGPEKKIVAPRASTPAPPKETTAGYVLMTYSCWDHRISPQGVGFPVLPMRRCHVCGAGAIYYDGTLHACFVHARPY
jgi:hypothetical protein